MFQNEPRWGGLCIDDKGIYWETLSEMARHFNRENDLILLQVRPDNAPLSWKPTHTYNLTSDAGIPYSTFAKFVVDTATSLGQQSDKGFFKSQAQTHIAHALEALYEIQADVTLENAHELLLNEEELDDALEELADGYPTERRRALVDRCQTNNPVDTDRLRPSTRPAAGKCSNLRSGWTDQACAAPCEAANPSKSWLKAEPMSAQSYFALTVCRAWRLRARRKSGAPSKRSVCAAKSAGVSATSRSTPSCTSRPSAPLRVATTGVPSAMASRIFTREPPPCREGEPRRPNCAPPPGAHRPDSP